MRREGEGDKRMTSEQHQQHPSKRQSVEQIFLACLLVSFLLHTFAGLFVVNIELPPPASQADYTEWVKRVAAPPEIVEEEPEPEEEKPEEKKDEPEEEEEEIAEEVQKQAKPSASASKVQQERREQVREAVKSLGILGIIGSASEEGDLANVFDSSSSAVNQNLSEALDSQSDLSASNRDFRKRGDGKVGDIGDVKVAAGGKVGGGRRQAAVPKAFVKSSDAKSFGGNANMKMLKRYMRKVQNKVETCYNIARKSNRSLKGDLTAQWTIMPDGRASNVRILRDTLSASSVRSCLTIALEKTVYRGVVKGSAPVVVQQTFSFGSTG